MLNSKILISGLIIVLAFFSCKKDEIVVEESTNPIEEKILKFIARLDVVEQNPDIEEAKAWNYSLDSAVWYIEAALNYKYSAIGLFKGNKDASSIYNTIIREKNIPKTNNGNYNIVKINELYKTLEDTLDRTFNSQSHDNEFFVLCDLSLGVKINSDTIIKQYIVIGNYNETVPNGDLFWGLGQGTSSGNDYYGLDATDAIENRLNNHRTQITQSHKVYLSISTMEGVFPSGYPLSNGQQNPTPYFDFLLFSYYSESEYSGPYLSESEINWYVDNLRIIEEDIKPKDKILIFNDISCYLYKDFMNPNSNYEIAHRALPFYSDFSIDISSE